MTEKIIVDIYHSYGKGDGEELSDRFVADNTNIGREEALSDIGYDDSLDSIDDFINGDSDTFSFACFGGDWDEPTGGCVIVNTKEELIGNINKKAEREIARIEELFN